MVRTKRGKIFRSMFALLLVGTLIMSYFAAPAQQALAANWADPYLDNLVRRNVMQGDADGNLNPNNYITRAEFVSMVNRAFGFTKKGTIKYKDVKAKDWFADDISRATYQGYFQGSGKNQAAPNAYLTREEAVTMLCRCLKIEGTDNTYFRFGDSRNFSNWSKEYINASTDKNFISGYPNNQFRAGNRITRGEVAKMLSVAAGEIVSNPGYGNYGYIAGNVSVVASGAELRNTTIGGDLYITEGVGLGYLDLVNVRVMGEVIISGTGESQSGKSSITMTDCNLNKMVVDVGHKKNVTIKTDGSTSIITTEIRSNTYLEEKTTGQGNSGFKDVILKGPSNTKLDLVGDFDSVKIMGEGNSLSLNKGYISNLTVDELGAKSKVFLEKDTRVDSMYLDTGIAVTGTGNINSVLVNANGINISMLPDYIYIRPGVTATINGKKMTNEDAEISSKRPEIYGEYPKFDEITATSADAIVKGNKPGKIYWAVRETGSGYLSVDDLIKGKDKSILKSGSNSVLPDKELTVKLSGLKAATPYEVSMVLVDLKDERSSVANARITSVDNVAPGFLSGSPSIKSATNNQVVISAIPTKDCSFYWAVLPEKSTAPKAEDVIKQDVAGAVKKGVTGGGRKNNESLITISGLQEFAKYKVYIVLKDNSGNISALSTLALATNDATPPEFLKGYPLETSIAVNSVNFDVMVNEKATLYWATYKAGAPFPAPSSTGTPDYNSDESKQAVERGTYAVSRGTVNLTAEKEGKLVVNGLQNQTPYDLYIFLQDDSKNKSKVYKYSIKTMDKDVPTAVVESSDSVGGKIPVGSTIKLVFSEIVMDVTSNKKLSQITAANLKNNIKLYDVSGNSPVAVTNINWNKVTVSDADAKTTVNFPASALPKLTSGTKYQFELVNIKDTSENKMPVGSTKLPFQMMTPTLQLEPGNADVSTYHMSFSAKPKQQTTADTMLYDLIFQADADITFDLYKLSGNSYQKVNSNSLSLYKGKSVLLGNLLKQDVSSLSKFKLIADTEYAIILIKVNGNPNSSAWDTNVKMNVEAVVGSQAALNAALGNYNNLQSFINNGSATLIQSPTSFVMTSYFSDSTPPSITPSFDWTDTTIDIGVKTDRKATVYWLLTPKGMFADKPSQDTVQNGSYQGTQRGSISVPSASMQVSDTIRDLKPNTEYDIFYYAQGNAFQPSEVYERRAVKTNTFTAPRFLSGYPNIKTQQADKVVVRVKVDTDCQVYWIVYPESFVPSTQQIKDKYQAGSIQYASAGDLRLTANQEVEIDCTGMTNGIYYKFYAFAEKSDGSMVAISDVVYTERMMPTDGIAPSINSQNTFISNISGNSYDGTISVGFSEPLYYRSGAGANMVPLTVANLQGLLTYSGCTNVSVDTDKTKVDSVTSGITYLVINFTGAGPNSTISVPYSLGDMGNISGQLYMDFVEDTVTPLNSKWNVQFR